MQSFWPLQVFTPKHFTSSVCTLSRLRRQSDEKAGGYKRQRNTGGRARLAISLDHDGLSSAPAFAQLSERSIGIAGIRGDIDRLWLRSEGERTNGVTEEAEIQALWGHSIGPWWDLVAGARQDFKPGSPQSWAAFGIQGMPLYAFEVEATAFIGESGQSAVRLEDDYDILLTNRLILQPTAELNFYGKNDPGRGIGSGLANTEVGLRLRYEIRR